jgi:uncharacterized protein YdeI (YjbR/CyaY-like superfamily)
MAAKTTTVKTSMRAPSRAPRLDAYIAQAPEFARPILARVRELVHASGPGIVETMKWGHPSFEYHGILGGMAAFKSHCAFGLWKHELIVADDARALEAMGSFGCLRTVADLPPRATLVRYVKLARKLNEDGVAAPRTKMARKKPIAPHPQFAAALERNAQARATLDGLAPSHRREYVEWIAEAKREDTRTRRIATAIEWLAQGKKRNWKYEAR